MGVFKYQSPERALFGFGSVQGIQDEMQAFVQILGNEEKAYQWLMEGEMEIRKKFCR